MILVHLFVILHSLCFSFSTSSLCRVLAAASDCGIPWTFLLIFMRKQNENLVNGFSQISSQSGLGKGPNIWKNFYIVV